MAMVCFLSPMMSMIPYVVKKRACVIPAPRCDGGRGERPAFTLIELLVVIAVIATLASILIPVVHGVIERSQSMGCVSNLREISMAIEMFKGENRGEYPRAQTFDANGNMGWADEGGFWFNAIGDYLDEGRRFHTDTQNWPLPQNTPFCCRATESHGWGGAGIDVGINGYMLPAGKSSVPRVRTESLLNPSETLLVADAWDGSATDSGAWQIGWGIAPSHGGEFLENQIALRHNGAANVLYFDGHVGQVTAAQLQDGDFVKKLGGTRI